MIIYELRKIFFNKPVIFSIFLLLVLYSVVCYIQTTISENAIPPDTLEEFFHLYSTNTDEMDQEYHQLIDFIDSQEAIWVEQMQNGNTDFEPDKWINRYAPDGFTDIQLFREVFGKANYIQNYSAEIERVIKNS